MNAKKSALIIIGVSLIAAFAMLTTAYLTQDPERSQIINNFIIAIWFIPFSYLTGTANKMRCE